MAGLKMEGTLNGGVLNHREHRITIPIHAASTMLSYHQGIHLSTAHTE